MDIFEAPAEFLSMLALVLLLLLNAHRSLFVAAMVNTDEELYLDNKVNTLLLDSRAMDFNFVTQFVLIHFRLWNALSLMDDDLGYWVKSRSTTWFSRFLLEEYDDDRWVQLFCMIKRSVFSLAHLLAPHIERQNTRYRDVVLVVVCLAYALFKLNHGSSLLICNEVFAIGRSTILGILREVVHGLNVVLKREIQWPSGNNIVETTVGFKNLCVLSSVLGAIDRIYIHVKIPSFASADYFYFKLGGFSMNCQVVVDSSKRFLDLYMGMPSSTNDSRMLKRSMLFQKGQTNLSWQAGTSFDGFAPYFIGDVGYPLLSWLMILHRRLGALFVAKLLFNQRLSKGRAVVENALGLLKVTFCELEVRTDLNVAFLPDVVVACAHLHNILLQQSLGDVERLLHILRTKGFHRETEGDGATMDDGLPNTNMPTTTSTVNKHRDLGIYLSSQRTGGA